MATTAATTKKTKTASTKKSTTKVPAKLPSAFSLIEPGISIIRNNLPNFLILAGIPMLLSWLGQVPDAFSGTQDRSLFDSHGGLWSFFDILGLIATLLAAPGIVLMTLAGVHKKTPDYVTAFCDGLHYFWRFLGLIVLLILMSGVALILLIVPFFILLPRIVLAPYYLVEHDLGPIAAIKMSMADYKKYKGTWGLLGVYFLITFANVIPFIGWILVLVANFLYGPAWAIRYEQIKALAAGKTPRTPIERKQSA